MSNSEESQPTNRGIGFSFSKKAKQTTIAINNRFNEDFKANDGNEVTEFVTAIDDNEIQSTIKKEEKKELIIPLIVNNRYYLKRDSSKQLKNETNNIQSNGTTGEEVPKKEETLEELAKRELLQEVSQWTESQNKKDEPSRVIPVIDSLMKNRVPEGFEANDNFDVSLRPIEPTAADYDTVPVEEFGLALLKGMGWKPGMAVGAKTKEMYIPTDPQIRPKGLGLGADTSIKKQMPKVSKDLKEEDLEAKKGSFVCIEFGAHKGSYGIIEDFDDDLSRITVRLTLKKEAIKIPVALVRVVSKQEFQTEGKVINKTQYEEYKQKEEKNDKKDSEKRHKSSDSHSKRSNSLEDKHKKSSSHKTWLLPNLRVRIIDKNYKNGKYYKEKVVISDVLTSNKCCCKTSDDRLLEDIDIKMLETVIPRNKDSNVMVLEGKYRKQLAVIVDKDKDRNEAEVQLLSDKRKVIKLNFDFICEYVD